MSKNSRMNEKQIAEFETRLGYQFNHHDVLQEALTHSSAAPGSQSHNERLEFLGDRVLGLVIAELLIEKFPATDEGGLARRLNALVRKEACAEVATMMDLGTVLVMNQAEARAGGRTKLAILGNACEAVLAAVYLDGGYAAAHGVVAGLWAPLLEEVADVKRDPKTALQEWIQKNGGDVPTYSVVSRDGPDHAPKFVMQADAKGYTPTQGAGSSKREAEQVAAEAMLRQEGIWDE